MARGVNKVILIGNLGKDPEISQTPSGGAVTNITVATTDSWKDKQTGEKKETTEWHSVVFFNRLAEIAGEYLKKGSKVYIEGSLKTEKYQDKATGTDRYSTKIIANEMQMLDGKGGSGDYAASSTPSTGTPQRSSESRGTSGAQENKFEDFDDDIPF